MGSSSAKQWHCRCGTQLAADNPGVQCAPCARASRDRFIAPPEVPPEFWQNEQLRDGFAAQHMGRIASAYRVHPYHQPTYGLHGISQRLLGQWIGLTQPQVSRIENGSPIRNLDTLAYWARTLRIPAELLWFRLLGDTGQLVVPASAGTLELPAGLSSIGVPNGTAAIEPTTDPEHDLVLVSPWSSRGTLEAAVVLGGGSRVKRRKFVLLTGTVLTAPAHQWLVHEPEPLLSGLAGHRVSGGLVTRLSAMVAELRKMDDVGGGGSVLAMAEQQFEWVAGLLDRASYDEPIGKMLYSILAELGQLAGWAAYDAGLYGLAQRYYIAALRAAHSADDRALGGFILGSMAEQSARQNRPAEAVTLIETAVAGTRGAQTPRLLAQLYNWQSYAFAVLEDTSSCNAAISRARRQAEKFEAYSGRAYGSASPQLRRGGA